MAHSLPKSGACQAIAGCHSDKCLVVGFSARAAAQAAAHQGFTVFALDRFGDLDLADCCQAHQVIVWKDDARGAEAAAMLVLDQALRFTTGAGSENQLDWPVLLAGGTENWPELLDALGPHFRVLGPNLTQLRQLRDPRLLAEACRRTNLDFPTIEFVEPGRPAPAGEGWLLKSTHGAGGMHVRRAPRVGSESCKAVPDYQQLPNSLNASHASQGSRSQRSSHGRGHTPSQSAVGPAPSDAESSKGTDPLAGTDPCMGTQPLPAARPRPHGDTGNFRGGLAGKEPILGGQLAGKPMTQQPEPNGTSDTCRRGRQYWQRFISGRCLGVVCVLSEADTPQILGATESLNACDWPGPSEFIYRGSWGPIPLSCLQEQAVLRLAGYLEQVTGTRGWLQMDFIEQANGQLALLEVNPRWTAGMELFHLSGLRPVASHFKAWLPIDSALPNVNAKDPAMGVDYHAKAVVYATTEIEMTSLKVSRLSALDRKYFADIPARPTCLPQGQPLITVLAKHVASTSPPGESSKSIKNSLLSQLRLRAARVLQLLS